MARGIIAIGLRDNDELISACISDGNKLIFIATRNGMAIKFPETDVRPMGRPAAGVTSTVLPTFAARSTPAGPACCSRPTTGC